MDVYDERMIRTIVAAAAARGVPVGELVDIFGRALEQVFPKPTIPPDKKASGPGDRSGGRTTHSRGSKKRRER